MAPHIVVVGSLNADFVLTMPRFPEAGETVVGSSFAVFPGGKGANQAYAAARLGARVSMVGQVGDDAHGAWLKQHLAAAGVDVAHIYIDAVESTGVAVIALDASGQNRIVITPGANGTLGVDRLRASEALLASANILLLQLEIPLPTVEWTARCAGEAGALVILDPAPACPLGPELLRCADFVTPNETELAALTGASTTAALDCTEASRRAAQLRAVGARGVIVKMGSLGALLVDDEGEHFWPAFAVTVRDTTAAGDAFNAAFAVALASGSSVAVAGRFATAAAACSVTRSGAQPSMPLREEVDALLGNRG